MKNKDKNLGGFLIVCPDCQKNNKEHETQFYVDWSSLYYTFICKTCGKTAYFDMMGEEIDPVSLRKSLALDKDSIFVN